MLDQTVLITGAANGLGKSLTFLFLNEEWNVIATDVDLTALQSIPSTPKLFFQKMDVTSDVSVMNAFDKIKENGVEITLIVNNAGIDRYFPFSEAHVERFKEVFEVNLFGSYRVNQTFLPILKHPGGRIIHIGSESLNLTIPFMVYPITKNALERYSKVLRQELRSAGIDVVLVRPGAIQTNLLKQLSQITPEAKDAKLKEKFARFVTSAPKNVGKILTPQRVAEFIVRVATVTNPKAVYKINNSFKLKIAALFPFRITEWIVQRMLGE